VERPKPVKKEERSKALIGAGGRRLLTAAEFQGLAQVPPEVEWFANIHNPQTRRAYQLHLGDFMAFVGIKRPKEFRTGIKRPKEFRTVIRAPRHRLAQGHEASGALGADHPPEALKLRWSLGRACDKQRAVATEALPPLRVVQSRICRMETLAMAKTNSALWGIHVGTSDDADRLMLAHEVTTPGRSHYRSRSLFGNRATSSRSLID
jgi:hypothetical protein